MHAPLVDVTLHGRTFQWYDLGAKLAQQFVEVLFAPGYSDGALAALRARQNIRILVDHERRRSGVEIAGDLDARRRQLRQWFVPGVAIYLAAVVITQAVVLFQGRSTPDALVLLNLVLMTLGMFVMELARRDGGGR